MIFIETSLFTDDLKNHLEDDEYRKLQCYLAEHPEAGDLVEGTGGLRKIRWAAKGKGKSGGVRIIYYHVVLMKHIRMLLIYRKGVRDTLSEREKAVLKSINRGWQ